jgi:hypothetical protein
MNKKRKVSILSDLISGELNRRNLWLFAGIEPIGFFKQENQKWYIKINGCSSCGKCCIDANVFNTGRCKYLKQVSKITTECELKLNRPFNCSTDDGRNSIPECTVKYKKVE